MIRSLTIGLPLGRLPPTELAAQVRLLLREARSVLGGQNLLPRTIRFTLPPADETGETEGAILGGLRWVDELAANNGVRWFCLPFDFMTPGPRRERLLAASDAISRFSRLFINLIVAEDGRIAIQSANDVAELILRVSRKSNNGFDNFRVGVSCNCPPNAPFFPYSRHEGGNVRFSFALETTNIALEATKTSGNDAAAARDRLVEALVPTLRKMDEIGVQLSHDTGVEYCGLDASLAPFPDGATSVGALIEQILGAPAGSPGSVIVTSLLTDALRAAIARSAARTTGFNGVMYSLLEDNHLAKANSRRGLAFDSFMAFAAVCGCGIDMIPIPGASFREEITAVILDVAGLSSVLKKPLGVRLLPIPNRTANEVTQFNLDFLCDSRILGLPSNDGHLTSTGHLVEFRTPLR